MNKIITKQKGKQYNNNECHPEKKKPKYPNYLSLCTSRQGNSKPYCKVSFNIMGRKTALNVFENGKIVVFKDRGFSARTFAKNGNDLQI